MHTAPADIRIEQPALETALTFVDVPIRGRSWDAPVYYGYRVARSLPRAPWLFVEAELIHGKVFAEGDERFTRVVQHFAMSHGLNLIFANALVRRSLTNRFTLTARGGAGPTLPHGETEVEGHRQEGYQVGGAGLQASSGLELRIWQRVSAVAEYKWTLARSRIAIHEGTATLVTRSRHLAMGVAVSLR